MRHSTKVKYQSNKSLVYHTQADLTEKRKCVKCNKEKVIKLDFYKRSTNYGGGRGYEKTCKECRLSHCKKTFREARFGITLDQYLEMVEEVNKKCEICGKEHEEENYKVLVVDHDHDTGNIRGLLCHNCNKALGLLKDNIENLKKAATYLEEHVAKNKSK